MLVLDGDLLLTVVCTAVGVVASWWFTRRHYTRRVPRKLTPEDVEIAKTRYSTISAFVGDYGALIVIVIVGGIFPLLPWQYCCTTSSPRCAVKRRGLVRLPP